MKKKKSACYAFRIWNLRHRESTTFHWKEHDSTWLMNTNVTARRNMFAGLMTSKILQRLRSAVHSVQRCRFCPSLSQCYGFNPTLLWPRSKDNEAREAGTRLRSERRRSVITDWSAVATQNGKRKRLGESRPESVFTDLRKHSSHLLKSSYFPWTSQLQHLI